MHEVLLPKSGIQPTRGCLGLLGLALAAPGAAPPQGFPERTVRLVVPFAPGGGVDAVGRILAEPLGALLCQPVGVENRAGAGGDIGVDAVAKSPPDGYAISLVSPGNMTAGPVVRPTPYDPLSLGFVTMVTRSPLLLVARNRLAAQNLVEFVALAKRQPEAIRFASGGVGTGTHLAAELVNLRLGTRMVHVPYRGTAPALTDLVAGSVDIFFFRCLGLADGTAGAAQAARGQLGVTLGGLARYALRGQSGIRFRHLQLVRHRRPARHARSDPHEARRGCRQGTRAAGGL